MANTYAVGAGVVLEFTFKDANGTLTDPSSAKVEVEHTDGTEETFTLANMTKASTGVYTIEVVAKKQANGHDDHTYYRGVGDGDVVCATPDQYFIVSKTRFAS